MTEITLTNDGARLYSEEGQSILDASLKVGINHELVQAETTFFNPKIGMGICKLTVEEGAYNPAKP